MLALLEDVVVSGTEGVAKPDPRIYDLARPARGPAARPRWSSSTTAPTTSPRPLEAGMDALLFTDAATLRADLRARGLPALNPRPGTCRHR